MLNLIKSYSSDEMIAYKNFCEMFDLNLKVYEYKNIKNMLDNVSIPFFASYLYYKIINHRYSFVTHDPLYNKKVKKINQYRHYIPIALSYILLANPNTIKDDLINIHPNQVKQMCFDLLLNYKTYFTYPHKITVLSNNKKDIYNFDSASRKYILNI